MNEHIPVCASELIHFAFLLLIFFESDIHFNIEHPEVKPVVLYFDDNALVKHTWQRWCVFIDEKDDWTALMPACYHEYDEIIDALLRRADIEVNRVDVNYPPRCAILYVIVDWSCGEICFRKLAHRLSSSPLTAIAAVRWCCCFVIETLTPTFKPT